MIGALDPRAIFGVVWLVIQAGLAIPIIVRLVRSRSRQGYSLVGEALWVVAGLGWIVYGARTESLTLIISGSLAAVTSALVVLLTAQENRDRWRPSAVWSALAAVWFVAMTVFAGTTGLSFALAAYGVVQFVPQLRESMRHLGDHTPLPGVSAVGSGARAVYTLGWAVYGLGPVLWGAGAGRVDWPLIGWGVAGAVAFGLLALAAAQRPRPEHPPTSN